MFRTYLTITLITVLSLLPITVRSDHFDSFDANAIPIELQGWWTPDYGHIHAAVFLPIGPLNNVSGILSMNIRVIMHNNPSEFYEIRFDDEKRILKRVAIDPPLTCTGTCAWEFEETLDTTLMQSGWREFRIKALTRTPDDIRYSNSSGIMLNVQNGGSIKDYHASWSNRLIGRGWYETEGYANAVIENLPITPLTSPHTFRIRAQKGGTARICYAIDKTHHVPATLHWPEQPPSPGVVSECFEGDFTCSTCWIDITVDPSILGGGWHSFAARAESPPLRESVCSGCSGDLNLLAGTAKIWFYVPEGGGTPTSPPDHATSPIPSDYSTDIVLNPTLSWTAGTGTTMHSVNFGTTDPPPFHSEQLTTNLQLSGLNPWTDYYWSVDEINTAGTTIGEVWRFTTGPGPTTASASISLSTDSAGRGQKYGRAIVAVVDDQGGLVENAMVEGSFSGDFSDSNLEELTGANGIATFDSSDTKKGKLNFGFCVEDVTNLGTTLTWDGNMPCSSF